MTETGTRVASACPETAVIAAFVDGALDADERTAVELHLADCDRCEELVTEVLRTQDVLGLSESAPVVPFDGRRRHRRVILAVISGALAAAAALLLIVRTQPGWWTAGRGSTNPRIAALVAAVGEERLIEGRLTGGFKHGPLRAPTRSDSSPATATPALSVPVAEARKAAEDRPDADNLHAWAVAQLLTGRPSEAVELLQRVVALQNDGRIESDLAAAYIAVAQARLDPDGWRKALASADRALALNPDLVEARFNRAIALEGLGRIDEAAREWRDVAARDSTSWRREAVRRLEQTTPR